MKEIKPKDKEITVKQDAPADLLTKTTGERLGFDDGDDKDLIIPRVKLVQSNDMANFDPATEGDIRPGMFINSITHEILDPEFIPIFVFKKWIKFTPMDQGGGIEWQSSDPNDPRVIEEAKWGENDEKPLATTFLNFFSLFKGCESPLLLSFSRTSYKAGKKLYSLAKLRPGDIFSRKYKLLSKQVKDKFTYWVFDVAPGVNASPEECAQSHKVFQAFYHRREAIVTDQEPENIGQ